MPSRSTTRLMCRHGCSLSTRVPTLVRVEPMAVVPSTLRMGGMLRRSLRTASSAIFQTTSPREANNTSCSDPPTRRDSASAQPTRFVRNTASDVPSVCIDIAGQPRLTSKEQWMGRNLGRPNADDRNRDPILAAAAEAFMLHGYAGTSVDDIADRLGASKGRIYHYYRSKADILFDIHRNATERHLAAVRPIAEQSLPAPERLRLMAEEHVRLIL